MNPLEYLERIEAARKDTMDCLILHGVVPVLEICNEFCRNHADFFPNERHRMLEVAKNLKKAVESHASTTN